MSLKEQVYSVLLVSAAEQFHRTFQHLLAEPCYEPVHVVSSISMAKQAIIERTYDFILINTPLPDDAGLNFAIDVCTTQQSVVLVFVRSEVYEETHSKLARHGVYTLSRPASRNTIEVALKWMESTRERLRKYEKKTLSIEEKMEEIRLVNRAKWLLIREQDMTEPDAHRYIEKQAMDQRVSKREIAESIIETYTYRNI